MTKYDDNLLNSKIGLLDMRGIYYKTLFPTILTGRIYPYSAKISSNRKYLSIYGSNGIADYNPSWIANIDGSIKYTYFHGVGIFWDANYNRLFMGPNIQYYDLQTQERRIILIAPDLPWAYYPDLIFQSTVRDQSPYHSGEFVVTNRYEYSDSLGNNRRDYNLIVYNVFTDKRIYVLRGFENDIGSCAYSPVDSLIAFTSFKNNQKDIYLISASGQELSLIVEDIYVVSEISWSPDGNKIAYSKEVPEKIPNVFFYNINTSEETQITFETKQYGGYVLNQWLGVIE